MMTGKKTTLPPHDFDFIIGNWLVQHKKLKHLLSNSNEWIEFIGESSTTKILAGYGNLEDNIIHLPEHTYHAAAIRSYNQDTEQWAIWWLDHRFPDTLDKPVIGKFQDSIGTFYAEDVYAQKSIKVRFIWNAANPNNPTWEQAFSPDNGRTWETNWVMSFNKKQT